MRESGENRPAKAEEPCEDYAYVRSAMEHLAQGISVFDSNLRLVLSNRRFTELLDMPEELGLPGTPFEALIRFNAYRGEYGPGDPESQIAERLELARQFKAHRVERIRPDGTVIEIIGNPLEGGGFVTTYTDTTERHRTAKDLRQSNELLENVVAMRTAELRASERRHREYAEFLKATVEHLPQGVCVFDDDMRLVVANDGFFDLTQVPLEFNIPGTPFETFMRYNAVRGEYGPGDPDELAAMRVELARKMEAHVFERTRQDGSVIEVRGNPIPGLGFISTFIDITARKRSEERMRDAIRLAEAANRAKTEFLAAMSHELRTPLNAILGFSEIITHEIFGPVGVPRYLEYAADVHASGQHLLSMINDILDISAIEVGAVKLAEDEVAPAELAATCLRLVALRAEQNRVLLDEQVANNLPHLKVDERRVRQVLLNLLSNAVKFTPAGGTVTLSVTVTPERCVRFRVADTGIGIKPEDIAVALAPFGQVDSGWARRFEGTGLGLPLAKSLVEMHDGTLEIASVPGQGTAVTVTFPATRSLPSP